MQHKVCGGYWNNLKGHLQGEALRWVQLYDNDGVWPLARGAKVVVFLAFHPSWWLPGGERAGKGRRQRWASGLSS